MSGVLALKMYLSVPSSKSMKIAGIAGSYSRGGEWMGIKRVLDVVKLDHLVFGRNWPKNDNLLLLHLYAQGE